MIAEQEILLAEILGKSKEYVIAHPETKLSAAQQKRFNSLSLKLKKGWPLAYLLGYKWFYGNKFEVNKNVLIPRPETEQLVDLALRIAKAHKIKTIADIGTGPGTIVVSIAKTLGLKPETKFFASDISAKALPIAKRNEKTILKNRRVKFLKGSLLSPLAKKLKNADSVLIAANLPYISKPELKEPSIKYEPKLALYGGKHAHDKIESLLKQTARLNLQRSWMILEINWDQASIVRKLIKKYLPGASIKIHKDFRGVSRFLELQLGF